MWKALLIFKLEILAFMELRFLKERKHHTNPVVSSMSIVRNGKQKKARTKG